ncbi:LysR family transcriptional regulator [Variovorax sp. Sphag1AA]|uniref:LysR family transcriptional regulator n=1 Tax=Variovorax sp. Sphag1AA TaxID=2587027 RepID=UPI001620C3DC|nr:LysR family transcriptional regulator [Variovorax sp. Sphag1AA]MBB3180868.1 DNA-binding transcriptional LysR family regulator [Variovorax sp. Sphag1AA]
MQKDSLTEFEVVLAVARRQGFRLAAVELEMSTSAVSNAVAGLEARLGVRLFHRTTRSVSLTEAGRDFVARIGPAVAQIQEAVATAGDRSGAPAGTLRINSSLGAALMVFRPILAEFLRRYPDMTVDVVTEGRLVDIVAEGFDAGLRLSPNVPRDMIRVAIGRPVRMAVVGSPGYFERHGTPETPSALAHHACIRARLPSGLPSPWAFAPSAKHGETIDVPGPLVLDSPLLMLEAAREGVGLAQIADWYVADDVANGRLRRVLDEWAAPLPELCLYYSGHRHVPVGLRALIDLIREMNRR